MLLLWGQVSPEFPDNVLTVTKEGKLKITEGGKPPERLNRLPRDVVMVPSLSEFKCLVYALSHTAWFFGYTCVVPGVGFDNPFGSLLTWDILRFYEK